MGESDLHSGGASADRPITQRGFFNSKDGTAIYYQVSGRGRPIILCYGLVCRQEHWRHQLRYFADDYQIITFDYRGHHRSGTPANDRNITLEWCAYDVQGLIEHLNLKEVVLFGHSMGVPVCTQVSILEPKRVKGQVLICGAVSNPFQGMFYTDRMDKVYRLSAVLYDWVPQTMTALWQRLTVYNRLSFFLTSHLGFNPHLAEEQDVMRYMEGVNQTPLSTFFSLIRDYVAFDGREQLKNIRCPSLVIAGVQDVITPLHLQEEMAQLIPQGELEKIPLGSHNSHADLPDMVNQKIENFLKRIRYV